MRMTLQPMLERLKESTTTMTDATDTVRQIVEITSSYDDASVLGIAEILYQENAVATLVTGLKKWNYSESFVESATSLLAFASWNNGSSIALGAAEKGLDILLIAANRHLTSSPVAKAVIPVLINNFERSPMEVASEKWIDYVVLKTMDRFSNDPEVLEVGCLYIQTISSLVGVPSTLKRIGAFSIITQAMGTLCDKENCVANSASTLEVYSSK